jgi:hypothetical protein
MLFLVAVERLYPRSSIDIDLTSLGEENAMILHTSAENMPLILGTDIGKGWATEC